MAGGDVVMASGNDLASKGGFSWDVHSSIVVEEAVLFGDASVVSEGGGDADIPKLFLSGYFFDLSMHQVGGWHDECSEVRWLEDDDVVVISLSLVVVVVSGQEICLLVEDAGFVSQHKVIFG